MNDACSQVALINVWSYTAETEIPYFRSRVVLRQVWQRGK
jgi:hypothetical protein